MAKLLLKHGHDNKVVADQIYSASNTLVVGIWVLRVLWPKICVQQSYLDVAPNICLPVMLITVPGNIRKLVEMDGEKRMVTNKRQNVR